LGSRVTFEYRNDRRKLSKLNNFIESIRIEMKCTSNTIRFSIFSHDSNSCKTELKNKIKYHSIDQNFELLFESINRLRYTMNINQKIVKSLTTISDEKELGEQKRKFNINLVIVEKLVTWMTYIW